MAKAPLDDEEALMLRRFDALMRRWSILILKDMFMGARRFNDFLEMNPRISGKVLSDQLKNLESCGYIEKVVVSMTPLRAEYRLTELGLGLNRTLYEMMTFSRDHLGLGAGQRGFSDEELRETFLIDGSGPA